MQPVTNPVVHPTAAEIAAEIRAELVCCNIYDRLSPILEAKNASGLWAEVTDENTKGHQICYWGEVAARIAETCAVRRIP